MNRQCERLIGILCQPIKNRHIDEIRLVTDWLRDTIPCLRTEESGIVHEVVRLGTYKRCVRDEVIACPAQKDDGIYIILSGSASVYVKQKHRDFFASEVGAINEELDDATTTTNNTNNTNTTTNTTTDTTTNPTTSTTADGGGSTVSGGEPPGRRRHSTTTEKKPGVVVADVERSTSVNNKPVPEKLNRDKMGKLVAKFSVGKCVGSAAVKTDETLRNATVLCDDIVHLLLLSQQVYDQTLKPSREQELTFRRKFIDLHPVFASCSSKVKQLLEMLLTKQFYPPGQPIVRQGDQYNGLVFILSGQANIVIEPDKHRTQYNEHLQTSTNQTEDIHNETAAKKSRDSDSSPSQRQRPSPILQDPIRVRKRHGYVAAEKRLRSRRLTVCCVERGEIVGDVELVAGLDTYCQTVTPTTSHPVDAYALTVKNIERIGSKAFLQSMNVLKVEVETKLTNRIERLGGSGPALFPCLLERLRVTDEERPVELPPLVSSKSLPTEEELFQHLLKSFVENRSALCQPYVPGAVFYRDMMRAKAAQRRSDPETMKPAAATRNGRPAARVKALLGPLKPLTTRAIKVALKRQEEELEKVEETARLHEMRYMEEERTRNECEKVRMDYRLDARTPPLTEKAMMNMQQVLLNKLRHHSTQNGGLPSDMEMDTGRSRTKIPTTDTTDPYKILLQSPASDKNAKLQAIKVRGSKNKLQTGSSMENGNPRSSMDTDRTLPPMNSETNVNEQQTDIKSLSFNNDDTERQNKIATSEHLETENELKSMSAIQADTNHEATKTDNKLKSPQLIDSSLTSKDTKPLNQTKNSDETGNIKLNEKPPSMITTTDALLGSADKIELKLERTRTLISEMDRHSEPADLQTEADDRPKEGLVREVHSARADVNLPPQQRRVPISREQIQVENRKMKEAVVLTLAKELCQERARNRLNKDLVSADDALYESPSYRDWETSDRSLKYLEGRIARFYVETEKEKERSSAGKNMAANNKPRLLPKLRRFEPTDDSPKHAVPGGRVYVKRRACDVQKANGTAVKNHDHVRYHLLPSIPNYDQLRTSKMVMFQMLDDARQQWIDEH